MPIPRPSVSSGRALILCGLGAAALFAGMNLIVPFLWPGYSVASQTVSELSAIDAPTRTIWVTLGTVYGVLVLAFGWGLWTTPGGSRSLRIAGAALMLDAAMGFFYPPMHLRGTEITTTDRLHIVWAAVTGVLMSIAMIGSAVALGRRFRVFAVASVVALLAFGAVTSRQAPGVAANLPTPTIGVWERFSVAAFVLWLGAFSLALLRRRVGTSLTDGGPA